jgi:Holliday junction DNA helicase RuvA
MIGWLQGDLSEPWQQANRCGALLRVGGVGYEVQLCQRHWRALPPQGTELSLHVHTSGREDGWTLYGFASRAERDLFRELVAVSGVGPQMALGLLGVMEPRELVGAIVRTDLRRLVQAPGVGRRTAERLAVELRQRLQERFTELVDAEVLAVVAAEAAGDGAAVLPEGEGREELQLTLAALGYEPLEIHRAQRAVAGQGLGADAPVDAWIRACLQWLAGAAA